ncbi:MAG: response regulator transcription factor [Chloroflexota bacterium]|nr:response regulator transcription factor [Chloroflexota bacterium]
MTPARILVVDDDVGIRDVVRAYAARDGFLVSEAADGYDAARKVETERPDLVILDLMVPGIDGWELCRKWRASGGPPIIMLTARGAESERILGLGLGADDYVVKPFSPLELMARVHTVLRRSGDGGRASTASHQTDAVLQRGDLHVDLAQRRATCRGNDIALTRRQLDLFAALMRNSERVSSRLELLKVLGDGEVAATDRAVDQHMVALRRALRAVGSNVRIASVRGIGYRLEAVRAA